MGRCGAKYGRNLVNGEGWHAPRHYASEGTETPVTPATSSLPDGEGAEHDGVLLERSRDDPERFAVLFDRHAAEFHRYVARRLDASTADDLVSEAFLIAFRKRAKFDPSRNDARPWLYGIVTRLVDQHRRKEARKYRALARGSISPVEESHDERVTSRVAAESIRHRLGKAMAGLAARDRDALLLYAWQELAYEDIAEALGIPVGTVRSRLNRARRKLREELGEPHPALAREEPTYE